MAESTRGGHNALNKKYSSKTIRTNISIPEEHREHLQRKYGKTSEGIRALIDADMGRDVVEAVDSIPVDVLHKFIARYTADPDAARAWLED